MTTIADDVVNRLAALESISMLVLVLHSVHYLAVWVIRLLEWRAGADGVLLEVGVTSDVDRVDLEQVIDACYLLDELRIHALGQDNGVNELGLIGLEVEDESMIHILKLR